MRYPWRVSRSVRSTSSRHTTTSCYTLILSAFVYSTDNLSRCLIDCIRGRDFSSHRSHQEGYTPSLDATRWPIAELLLSRARAPQSSVLAIDLTCSCSTWPRSFAAIPLLSFPIYLATMPQDLPPTGGYEAVQYKVMSTRFRLRRRPSVDQVPSYSSTDSPPPPVWEN